MRSKSATISMSWVIWRIAVDAFYQRNDIIHGVTNVQPETL